MKRYEIIFKIIIVCVFALSIVANFVLLNRTTGLSDKIAEISAVNTRIESLQSDIREQNIRFEEEYGRLGITIESFGEGFAEFGNTISNFSGTIQNLSGRVSNLTGQIQNFSRGLPEIQTVVRESGNRISEAERIIQELIEGNN